MSLLENYFHDYILLFPSFQIFLGIKKNTNVIENNYSLKHRIKVKNLINKYNNLLKNQKNNNIDNLVLKYIINDFRNINKYNFHYMPIDSFNNPIIDFKFFNKTMFSYETIDDISDLISRHYEFIKIIKSMKSCIIKGINTKIVIPKLICKNLIKSLDKFIENKEYKLEINNLIYNKFLIYYEKILLDFLNFLKNIYYKHCRTSIGICYLPNGKNMYRDIVKSSLTINYSPEKIHYIGRTEVKRILEEINKIKDKLNYKNKSLKEFHEIIMNDSNNFYKNKNDLILDYEKTNKKIKKIYISKYFSRDVKNCDIKEVPESMKNTSAGAFYLPGSYDMSRRGLFYINTRNLKENPKYAVKALSSHENIPGHHYQFQYMIEKNIPMYKIYSINGTSFVEGWALYAENITCDKKNLLEYFGKLNYELFRAVRLVVDTGIHYYGWSYSKSIKYMKNYLAMQESEIISEINRYICIPGQALCYKIGELTILNLRTKFLKYNKNLKEFHDKILENGVLPLDILRNTI